jgi:hypothetical protein
LLKNSCRTETFSLHSLAMKSFLLLTVAFLELALPGAAVTLLDDTWVEGSRTEQKPPTQSAWFASNSTNLVATAGKLTAFGSSSSRQFITYFPVADGPVSLAKTGDAITATITFRPWDVTEENPSHNLRLGLFDSVGKRIKTDSVPHGGGAKGYALFLNFGQKFGTANAFQINARTNLANTDLMGATGAYSQLSCSGQPANHSAAFTNGGLYTLSISVKRAGVASMDIKTTVTGGGLSLTNSASDLEAVFTSFDAFAIRTSSAGGTAGRFEITEFKVEGPSPSEGKHQ